MKRKKDEHIKSARIVKDDSGRVREPCYSCDHLRIDEPSREYFCKKNACNKAFDYSE